MTHRIHILAAVIPLATAACAANFHDYVASVASDKMSCPKGKIKLTPVPPGGYEEAYRAEGCGHNAIFAGRCSLGMCSSQMVHSQEALAAMTQDERASNESVRQDDHRAANAQQTNNAPQTVSLQVHNQCRRTVKMFVGKDPQRSSGTTTTMSANESRSFPMLQGDILWLVDESGRPLGSTSASRGPFMDVAILESCTGFGPY